MIERSRGDNERLRTRIDSSNKKLRDMLMADEPDEAAVLRQADEIGELQVEENKNRMRAILEIRKMMTPEQRRELDRIREEFHAGSHDKERGAQDSQRPGSDRRPPPRAPRP